MKLNRIWLQHLIFALVLGSVFYFRMDEVAIPPSHDENYHLTDELVRGSYSMFNIFAKNQYNFFGHPPGYPISLKIFFDLFGADHSIARIHSLFFSFMTVFIFYLLCREYLAFPAALLLALSFYFSQTFYNLAPRIVGDVSALFFALATMKALFRCHYKIAAVTMLLCVVFRESGLALPVSILAAYLILQRGQSPSFLPSPKTLALIIAPAIGFLALFFTFNYFNFGHFSRHPYALGELIHIESSFFAWSEFKWRGLRIISDCLYRNFGVFGLATLFFGGLSMIFKRYNSKFKSLPMLSFFLMALSNLCFFILYGDAIYRDIIPFTTFLFFFIALLMSRFNWLMQSGLALAFLIYTAERLEVIDYATPAKEISQVVSYVDGKFPGRRIYIGWPVMDLSDQIHGYFQDKSIIPVFYEDPNVEVIAIDSLMNEHLTTQLNKVIVRHNMTLVDEVQIGTKNYKFFTRPLRPQSIKNSPQ